MPGASRIRRSGDVVRRPLGFWSPAVHHLLRYLQDTGFPAPRVLGTEDRDELLTWIGPRRCGSSAAGQSRLSCSGSATGPAGPLSWTAGPIRRPAAGLVAPTPYRWASSRTRPE